MADLPFTAPPFAALELPVDPGIGVLLALVLVIAASVWLGTAAQRAIEHSPFLQGYFLGNRGLGAWAVALTATVQSGGTFMGFPSLVYSHGWVLALWIAGYMMVPITGFGVLGKRLAQFSRRTGAVTAPDLFRERYGSPAAGLVASLLILFFMSVMMVAQFKAGALVMKLSLPGTGALAMAEDVAGGIDWGYYVGLGVFTVTVVGYTMIGGFLAAVWTDLFQSILMFFGVMILLFLALPAAGGLEAADNAAIANTGPGFVQLPGYSADGRDFLPIGLAFSMFFIWIFSGLGNPAGMVRVMACKDTTGIRRSIFLLNVYNVFIYIPLIIICICGRALIPGLPAGKSDELIPRLTLGLTADIPGGSFLAGLVLAAPFGAVMATVSCYLMVIASGLIRDVYQRFINPGATDDQLRRLSRIVMIVVGLVAVAANIRPVDYLQALVTFSGSSAAAAFAIPALMAAFWRRATSTGTISAMIGGAATVIGLFVVGFFTPDPMVGMATRFRPYFLMGVEPIIWGLGVSLALGAFVSLLTAPPAAERVGMLFEEEGEEMTKAE